MRIVAVLAKATVETYQLAHPGQAARHAPAVKRVEPAIVALYTWARKNKVPQAKHALDTWPSVKARAPNARRLCLSDQPRR